MKTKILIGSIAAVVAVGATIGIIAGIVSKNKKNRRIDPEETKYSQQDASRDYSEDQVWTETTESETTATTQQITEDSFYMCMDGMSVDECVENIWKTGKVHDGMTKEEYFKNMIVPEEDPPYTTDNSFSWNFQPALSGGKFYIGSLQVFSGISCPVVYEGGDFSAVRLQLHFDEEDAEFANKLVDKLIEKYISEGFTLEDDTPDLRGARLVHIGGSDHVVSIVRDETFISLEIPLVRK